MHRNVRTLLGSSTEKDSSVGGGHMAIVIAGVWYIEGIKGSRGAVWDEVV